MRRLLAVFGLTLMALPAWAQDFVSTFSLDNGMDVVVIEDHRAPAVVHMVWYRAGAADEPPGASGIAHFLEHLLFKATDDMESGQLSKVVAENGGTDNAFTSWDYTAYFQRIAADRLDLMMTMEADRMRDIQLTESDILTERDVILEERNQRTENNPAGLFGEERRAAQYLNHPYSIPIIGWKHEMQQLSMDDAMDFYRTYYAPNNAILIVAGDVTPEEVRVLAEKHYGVLEPTVDLPERARPQEPPQRAERRIKFEDPRVAQPYVIRTYLAPERDSGAQEQAAALVMLAELLGGEGATSFLGRKLQFESQTAIYTAAFYSDVSLDDTTFGLAIVPNEGISLQEAEDALDQAVADFITEGVDTEALNRLKMQMRAEQIYERDNVGSVARRYGAGLTSGLTVEDIQAWPDILQAVTEEDIIAAAEMVFDEDKAVTGWLMKPQQDAEVLQ
ncbi:M16 family metallopeptidase [Parasulfitobacter algicola]|uniref:Insulinase family protein n=1 Tax=Parasulfitobacter algicola TaxID=2614809 RepID=A0ABX2IQ49_9RHOB|nr:pitrilysin family protein [Sulfitobacter algicola]NSX55006.1 insulinase family protein [Sulfitobacter algicola]